MSVPGDKPTVTTDVEPARSPDSKGITLPKTPRSLPLIAFAIVGTFLIVFAIFYFYNNVAT